ncbi:Mismatch repair protein msh3 [Linnemannia exigua]|uniref:DNA mismatch repair protein n=1 Tax=Linnemannia exigua TaxID=604196 RepID=A0AAD4DFW3_9FUNG|nr:Mismatch repair protein msh3 [Linnemannia exigua]
MAPPKNSASSTPVQKTLLNFFKPKSESSPIATGSTSPTTTSLRNPPETSSHTSSSNNESAFSKHTETADDNQASKGRTFSSTKSKQQQQQKRTRATPTRMLQDAVDDEVEDLDEPLFPSGFAGVVEQFGRLKHSSPVKPSTRKSQSQSQQAHKNVDDTGDASIAAEGDMEGVVFDNRRSPPPPSSPLKRKSGKSPNEHLASFGYKANKNTLNVSSDNSGAMEGLSTEEQEALKERRERFKRKLGPIADEVSSGTGAEAEVEESRPSRRRRLIVSESDEEMDQGAVEDDDEYGGSSKPRSRNGVGSQKASAPDPPPAKSSSSSRSKKSIYTPLEQQYLDIKGQYPDALLCIEVGYKYRFFDKDAEIASRVLSIAHFMDRNFYTASIPIHRLDVHVRRLVHAGHKVGVVKQMETAALKSAGDNKSAPFTRKLTNLYTKATFIESLDQDEEQTFVGGRAPSSQFIMCIHEQLMGGNGPDEKVKLAMIAVQPATGDIVYDEFVDGHFRNELETRLLHLQPAELIVPMEPMSKATEKLLGHLTAYSGRGAQDDVRIERTDGFIKYDRAFSLVTEFYSDSLKEEQLKHKIQGERGGGADAQAKKSQKEALLKTVLGLSKELIVALSAILTHLSAFGLASIFRLSKYFECFTSRSHMLLNGNTISNLELYRNQTDGTSKGSLFAILDHTDTGFGRRLLKKWVGKPLVDREALQERVDAVEEILALTGKNVYLDNTRAVLKGLMDMEKGVCRIHYGKSSPKEFLAIVQTFVKVSGILPAEMRCRTNADFGLTSPMLNRLIGSLSNALEDSQYFLDGLCKGAAAKNDKLLMFQDELIAEKWPEIHAHRNEIIATENDFKEELVGIRKLLREPKLEFATVSAIDYLVEVKNKDTAKVPKNWVKISGTKQVSRFHTPEVIQLVASKAQHQERLVMACDQAFLSFQHEFSERYEVFRDLVQNLAVIDCLFSLAVVACLPGYVKPQYVDDDQDVDHDMNGEEEVEEEDIGSLVGNRRTKSAKTTVDIKNGRHPMVEQLMLSSGSFVANDIQLGTNTATGIDEKTIILTGPNMGGKSCYIRTVALLCIMAQIGSYLPADSARVSMLDAVYTRMGASDNIFGHESTFMVELQETSDILKMATERSLVILDELGRGTSTLDGVAIAYAVLKHVVQNIRAVTLFVTHYPSLADVAREFPMGAVRNFHMGFMASAPGSLRGGGGSGGEEGDLDLAEADSADGTGGDGTGGAVLDDMDIVFLYKLVPGVSLKSYGLNVARMAKLSGELINKAKLKSKELEQILERRVKQRQLQKFEQKQDQQEVQQPINSTVLLGRLEQILGCKTEDQASHLVQDILATSRE